MLAFEERWEGERLHFSAGALGQSVAGRVDVMDKKRKDRTRSAMGPCGLGRERYNGRVRNAGTLLLGPK